MRVTGGLLALALAANVHAFDTSLCRGAIGGTSGAADMRTQLGDGKHAEAFFYGTSMASQMNCASCKTIAKTLIDDPIGSLSLTSCHGAPNWISVCLYSARRNSGGGWVPSCDFAWRCVATEERADQLPKAAQQNSIDYEKKLARRLKEAKEEEGTDDVDVDSILTDFFLKSHPEYRSACANRDIARKLVSTFNPAANVSDPRTVAAYFKGAGAAENIGKTLAGSKLGPSEGYSALKRAWMAEAIGKKAMAICGNPTATNAMFTYTDKSFATDLKRSTPFSRCRKHFTDGYKDAVNGLMWQAMEFGCFASLYSSKGGRHGTSVRPLSCPIPVMCNLVNNKAHGSSGCSYTNRALTQAGAKGDLAKAEHEHTWGSPPRVQGLEIDASFYLNEDGSTHTGRIATSCPLPSSANTPDTPNWVEIAKLRKDMHVALTKRWIEKASEEVNRKIDKVNGELKAASSKCKESKSLAEALAAANEARRGEAGVPTAEVEVNGYKVDYAKETLAKTWTLPLDGGRVVCRLPANLQAEDTETIVKNEGAETFPSVADFLNSRMNDGSVEDAANTAEVSLTQTFSAEADCTFEAVQGLPIVPARSKIPPMPRPRCGENGIDCTCPPAPEVKRVGGKAAVSLDVDTDMHSCAIRPYYDDKVLATAKSMTVSMTIDDLSAETDAALQAIKEAEATLRSIVIRGGELDTLVFKLHSERAGIESFEKRKAASKAPLAEEDPEAAARQVLEASLRTTQSELQASLDAWIDTFEGARRDQLGESPVSTPDKLHDAIASKATFIVTN